MLTPHDDGGRRSYTILTMSLISETELLAQTPGQLYIGGEWVDGETGATITHVYPGAEHGFSSRDRHGNPVNADAYAVSWPQALSFIGDTVRS